MHHITLVVGSQVSHTLLHVKVVSPELEDGTFFNPLVQWSSMNFTEIIHHPKSGRVTVAQLQLIQPIVDLSFSAFMYGLA